MTSSIRAADDAGRPAGRPASRPVRVRPARASDLPHLTRIEGAADALFVELFRDPGWAPPTPGEERARTAGFLLVADDGAPGAGGAPVGFAHVLEEAGEAHLEQLAVHPDHGRRGLGSALTRAALAEAARRGYAVLSLCTYADVPWNAPFYRRLGFAEVPDARLTPFLRGLRDHERALGLEEHGRRVVMARRTAG